MKQTSRKAKALLLKFKNYSDEELIDFVVEKQQGLDDESLISGSNTRPASNEGL